MNILKSTSPIRLIAFFLVAVMLICTFGFAVDGWNVKDDTENKPSGKNPEQNQGSTDLDKNDTKEDESQDTTTPEIYIPKFTSYITGLEVSEEISNKKATAIVMNPSGSSYAISSAELVAEFPIEDGSTRFLAFITDWSSAGKIGAILPTRSYISNLACYFDALTLSNGIDDSVFYKACDFSGSHFDLSKHSGYHYSEFTHYQYTNPDLLNAGLKNVGLSTVKNDKALPYVFNEFGAAPICSSTEAASISIQYSDSSDTEFHYSADSLKYTMHKNGEEKKDMLNGKNVEFANCLVLFADSITYESANGSQMIMSTASGGTGYYFTNGSAFTISWSADTDGNMTLFDDGGNKLTINRGNTYIGYVKSTRIQSVSFE